MTDNPPILTNISKIENRITFKIKTGYYHELLTLETLKFLGSTKIEIKKKKRNDKNVPHLEITGVMLIHCNLVNDRYQQNSRVFYAFVPNKSSGQ